MPTITDHPAGTFCWFELGTRDQAGAKQFYTSLFGWDAQDYPMGPSDLYTIFKLGGRDVAATYTMRPDQQAAGMPNFWLLYVRVESADASAARAEKAGAKIVAPPFDVPGQGRMAIFQDPVGAGLAVWEPKGHQGTGAVNEDGAVVWADLITSDQARAAAFYSELFGWKFVAGKSMVAAKPGEYFHIVNGDAFIGGVPPAHGPSQPAHWMMYVSVPNAANAMSKAISLGGNNVYGPVEAGERRFAALADSQGAVFAVVDNVAQTN